METKVQNKAYFANEIHFEISDIKNRTEPRNILMASPDYFDVIDIKNVHMAGNAGKIDKKLAHIQWNELKSAFNHAVKEKVLDNVLVIDGAKDCEDMVFTANQSFPWIDENGNKIVVMSKMRHDSRKREVPFFEAYYQNLGYKTLHLNQTEMFEGMGDLIPHIGKRLLYGGYGHRTNKDAYTELSALLQVPIIALELIDERFYHLDTCYVSLGKDAVMICKEAFTPEGLQALAKMYKRVYYIPIEEAVDYFALNAHTVFDFVSNKKIAFIHKGTKVTYDILKKEGFEIIEIDTSEYMKSGGSVFCMKMMVY